MKLWVRRGLAKAQCPKLRRAESRAKHLVNAQSPDSGEVAREAEWVTLVLPQSNDFGLEVPVAVLGDAEQFVARLVAPGTHVVGEGAVVRNDFHLIPDITSAHRFGEQNDRQGAGLSASVDFLHEWFLSQL